MHITDSAINRLDTPSRTPSPVTEKSTARAPTPAPHTIHSDQATFSSSRPYSAITPQSKRQAEATAFDHIAPNDAAAQTTSSGDPFQGVPQAAIEDSGVPDLDQLPKLGEGPNAPLELQESARDFWDPYPPPKSGLTRLKLQYQKAASSLTTEADVRTGAGWLSAQGNQVVRNALTRDDDASHGVYTMQIGSGDNAASRTTQLNGLVIMTEKPLGYSYQDETVKDRLERPSTTVLYMPGRDGTLREFPTAQAAFDWVNTQLRSNPAFKEALLARQTPEDQAKLSQAIDGDQRASGDGEQLKLFAQPMSGNPAKTIVNHQIDTWKTVALNTDTTPPGAWSASVGLDVSRSDESRVLEVENSNNQLIRDRLPPSLKNLQLSDADKHMVQSLAQDNQTQRTLAESYYGDTPSFSAYADAAIAKQIKTDKGVEVDPSQIMVTVPTRTQIASVSRTQLPQAPLSGTVTYPLTEFIAQQMANLPPSDWRVPLAKLSGPGSEKLDIDYVKTLSDTLNLEKNYTKRIHETFDRPTSTDDAAAFDVAQAAAKKANAGTLKFDALIARRSGDLTEHDYQMVLDVIAHPDGSTRPVGADGKATQAYGLALNGANGRTGNSLRDVTVFAHDGEQGMVVYTPNAPDGKAFRTYADRTSFMADLRQQLASIKNDDPGQWSPMAQYWAGQFGAHQVKDSVPWLRQVADGNGGSELNQVRIDKDFFQSQYDYRVGHLLADADANAMTDNEITLEKGIKYANMAYQVAKMIVPNWATVPFELSEVSSNLFSAYQAYNLGDKEGATNALGEALTGAVSVPGYVRGASVELGASRKLRPIVATSANALRVETPKPFSADTAGFVPLPPGSRFAGLYAKDAKLYDKKDGKYREVYVDKSTQTVRLQPESRARSAFFDPELRRDADGDWKLIEGMTLKGGGRSDEEGPSNASGGNTPGTSKTGARGSGMSRAVSAYQQKVLVDLDNLGDEWKHIYVMDRKFDTLGVERDLAKTPEEKKRLSDARLTIANEYIQDAKKYFSSFKPDDSKTPDLTIPKNARPGDFIKIASSKSNGISIGESHSDSAAQQYIADNLDYLKDMGYQTLYVERYLGSKEIHDKNGIPTTLTHEARSRGMYVVDVESTLSRGDDTFGKNFAAHLVKTTLFGGDPGERLKSFSYHLKYTLERDLKQDPTMRYIVLTGNGHASMKNSASDNFPGVSDLLNIPTAYVTTGWTPGISALPGKRFSITTGTNPPR